MEETKKKGGFGSKFGFIMAAAGSAVGLGNLWGFPYKAGSQGGAAFVVVYIAMVLLIGTVVMIAEMQIGKRAKTNVVDSYKKINKKFGWVGFMCVLIPFIISCYYIVIGGWAFKYTVNYVFEPSFLAPFIEQGTGGMGYFASFISSAYEPVLFTLVFLAISIVIVCGGVKKGIEKVSKIMMPTLFVLLLILVVRSLTLGEGVKEGLDFYLFKFDFKELGWDGVLAAMGQAFFSLSLGMGAMMAYGSYSGKKVKIGKSALIVCGLDTSVALLAGLAIFPAVFAYGLTPSQGPSLLFATLSEVFAAMPGGSFFGFLFFGLVVLAAVTSVISLLEVVSQYTIDKLNWTRKKATIIFGTLIGAISVVVSLSQGAVGDYNIAGFDLLTFFDDLTNIILMPLAAIFACVSAGWMIKPANGMKYKPFNSAMNTVAEIRMNGERFRLGRVWAVLAQYVTPALIAVVWVFGIVDKYNSYKQPFEVTIFAAAGLIAALIAWNFFSDSKFYQNYVEQKKLKAVAAEQCAEDDE